MKRKITINGNNRNILAQYDLMDGNTMISGSTGSPSLLIEDRGLPYSLLMDDSGEAQSNSLLLGNQH